jgi:2-keto-4-pentenoate hydratase/2-oxohepta-3-ene-1,7-dioic acid hydratase in catechol pathway
MRIVTFNKDGRGRAFRIGAFISDTKIVDLTHLVSNTALNEIQVLTCFDIERGFIDKARIAAEAGDGELLDRKEIRIASPVPRPGKVICIGLNYRDHAAESGMPIPKAPVIFSKFSSCVIGPGESIVIPPGSVKTDYEAELAFVIGRRASRVTAAAAMSHVFGYLNFNDVSARDFQFADGQWQRGKSCDTFAPTGEYVVTSDEIPDPQDLSIKLRLNGETMQDSNTRQMIFGVAELVEFLSLYIVLEPGDVVATGTPPGVGFARKPPVYLQDGDVVEVEIEGLGTLSNPVAASI